MKNISFFLIGTASTMGMTESIGVLPDVLDVAQSFFVDSTEAIASVVGGIILTMGERKIENVIAKSGSVEIKKSKDNWVPIPDTSKYYPN